MEFCDMTNAELDDFIREATREKELRAEREKARAWENVISAIKAYTKEFGTITCVDGENNAMYLDQEISFDPEFAQIEVSDSTINY